MSCQCGSVRIIRVSAKCSDRCWVAAPHLEIEKDGYVPTNIGLGDDEDYIDVDFCVDCGRLQGKFPVSDAQIKKAFSE